MHSRLVVICLVISAVLACVLQVVEAWGPTFSSNRLHTVARTPLQVRMMGAENLQVVSRKIEVVGRNMDLSDTLRERVDAKVGKVISKLGHNVLSAHVALRVLLYPNGEHHTHVTKKDSQIAEITLKMKGGAVIHSSEHSEDMYASIDIAAHTIAKNLKRHNEKLHQRKTRRGIRDNSSLFDADAVAESDFVFDENELIGDLDARLRPAPSQPDILNVYVSKTKAFEMPPISLEDAVGNLALIDHSFYVFRNKDTQEVNVVYKRKDGQGYGHIVPTAAAQ